MVNLRLQEIAQREHHAGEDGRRARQAPHPGERKHANRRQTQVQQPQEHERALRREQQEGEQCGRIGQANLAVGEDRIAAEDLWRPQREHPLVQLLRDPAHQREIEDGGVPLVGDAVAE